MTTAPTPPPNALTPLEEAVAALRRIVADPVRQDSLFPDLDFEEAVELLKQAKGLAGLGRGDDPGEKLRECVRAFRLGEEAGFLARAIQARYAGGAA